MSPQVWNRNTSVPKGLISSFFQKIEPLYAEYDPTNLSPTLRRSFSEKLIYLQSFFTVMDMASQHQESVTLCCEVLNLLNNCNPQGKTSMLIMDTLIGWMMSSHSSILILPMVTSAGRTLASVTQMARIVECGIESHFQQGINYSAFWTLWFRSRMPYLFLKRIAGSFRVSLLIDLGCTWNLGIRRRRAFDISKPI